MRISSIKLAIIDHIPYKFRISIKRKRRDLIKKIFKRDVKRIGIEEIQFLLEKELHIVKSDNLIISSSFGNLNANFTPRELILFLQDLIGPGGNIVMPFYPSGNSIEWAKSGKVFNMKTTPSSMGVLTQVFSEMPDVYKSKHPIKAVVAWGKNAKSIVHGHEHSTTPFYWDSPYGWLLKNKSKSLGIGVSNRPIIHACEDVLLTAKSKYLKDEFNQLVKDYNNTFIEVNTLIHNHHKTKSRKELDEFIKKLKMSSYKKINIGYSFCYVFNNQELLDKCKKYWINDN